MRRSRSIVVVALVTALTAFAPAGRADAAVCPGTVGYFPDVPATQPFCYEISLVTTSFSFMHGYPDGTFRPGAAMSRQAVASTITALYRESDEIVPECEVMPFPDVPLDHPFCEQIQHVKNLGLMKAYGDGTFRPANAATRQSMIVLLYRSREEPLGPDPACTEAPFPDVPITNAFCGEIAWAQANGITEGYSDGTFRPAQVVTRQAFSYFVVHTIMIGPHP